MKFYFVILLIFINYLGFAQANEKHYTIKWLNAENGLKQLSVRYCVPDNYGFVWIATELGLYRYDGLNLVEIKDKRYPSLSKQRITRLGKDEATGKIYLQTSPEDYQYVIDQTSIEQITPEKKSRQAIFTFNNFCFTASNPLVKNVLNRTNSHQYIKEYGNVTSLSACLTSTFLYLPRYDHLLVFDRNGFIKNDYLFSNLQLMQFGETIVAATKHKVSLINKGEISSNTIFVDAILQKYLDRDIIIQSSIEIFGSKNRYYLKYNGDIFQIRFQNNTLTTHFLFKTPAEDISSIAYSEKENFYIIGTRTQGVAVLKPVLFNTIYCDEKKSNKSSNYCYAVAAISDKEWYSASGWHFNPKSSEIKVDTFLIDKRSTRFILPYRGQFYNNSKGDFWNIKNNKNDYDFNFQKSNNNNYLGFSGFTYHNGQLYLSNNIEIYFLKNNTLETDVSLNKKFNGREINGICSIDNKLIIPTTKGVYCYLPNTKKVTVVKGLENVNSRYIKPINKQSYWVGCYGDGLFLVDKNIVYKVTDATIDLNTAHAIEEDAAGNLWISTNDGILATNKREAFYKIRNKQPINCYRYSTDDGLLTNEFNGGGTHPSLHTKEGIIGFPSMKGFVWFQPNHITKHLFTGTIVLNSIVVNNKTVIAPKNNQYSIPKNVEVLDFNFSYGYYYNRDNLTIAYRFEDQANWTTIKGNSFQVGRYKKGTHKLLIRITTHGFDDKQGVTKAFQMDFEARYYEESWFWLLIVLLSLSLLVLSYQIGLYLNKNRALQLQAKIDEKTTELSQNIVQLETSKAELENSKAQISKSLHEKDVLLKEVHHRVKNNLQLIMSMLNIQARRNNYANIHEFLQKGENRISAMSLIHQRLYQSEEFSDRINIQLYIEDLVISINQTFENMAERIQVNVNAHNIILNLSTAIPLGLIVNELVTNALKHGFPDDKKGIVSVAIQNTDAMQFELIIADNGVGFNKENKKTKSFGLDLISLLTAQLNGTVIFENQDTTKATITFQEIA